MANSRFEYVKTFETDDRLLPDCWMVVRVDGKQFKSFTDDHHFRKPHDDRGLKLMNRCADEVMRQCKDIVLAIGASDEFSFVLRRDSILFKRRSSKICTYIVSLFTSCFVFYWNDYFGSDSTSICAEYRAPLGADEITSTAPCVRVNISDYVPSINPCDPVGSTPSLSLSQLREIERAQEQGIGQKLQYPPSFDGRVVLYPTDQALKDYLAWRQADFHINNLYNTCFWQLVFDGLSPQKAEAQLTGTFSEQKNELLFSKYGINYAKLPACYRKGSILIWDPCTFGSSDADFLEEDVNKDTDKNAQNTKRLKTMNQTNDESSRVASDVIDVVKSMSLEQHTHPAETSCKNRLVKPSVSQLVKMSSTDKVIVLHKDLIQNKFWQDYPGIVPYIAPSDLRKLLKKKIKAERREQFKKNCSKSKDVTTASDSVLLSSAE